MRLLRCSFPKVRAVRAFCHQVRAGKSILPPSTSRYERFATKVRALATMVRALAAGTSFGHQGTSFGYQGTSFGHQDRALTTRVSFGYHGMSFASSYELSRYELSRYELCPPNEALWVRSNFHHCVSSVMCKRVLSLS